MRWMAAQSIEEKGRDFSRPIRVTHVKGEVPSLLQHRTAFG